MKKLKFVSTVFLAMFISLSLYAGDEKPVKKKSCTKECGIAHNKCNNETGKLPKKSPERKASHEKCQTELKSCKSACKTN
jgi:hypothetical protein